MRIAVVFEKVQAAWKGYSKRERREVRKLAMCSSDMRLCLRCKIVLNLHRGEGAERIHQILGCSLSQVYRIADRFVEDGATGLIDRREDNGETKVDESFAAEVLRLVADDSPQDHKYRRPTWTQELLVRVMEEITGIRVSTSSMCRLLAVLEIRLGRPKPIVGCPWKKGRRTKRLRHLERLIENVPEDEVVVYADEVDIDLNPKIGPDYMLRGTQKQVLTPGKNEKRYLAGALCAKTGKLTWVEWDRKDSDLFILQLWQLVREDYPKAKCIHIILDNYSIHSSARTNIAVAALEGKVKLHFLPPYCPDHNRIERVCRDLHDNVTRNHRCKTMATLMQEVRAYLAIRQLALKHEYATQTCA